MPFIRALAALVVAGLLAALAPAVPATGADLPAVEVRVAEQAYEGPRGTILADVSGRCAPGYDFGDLELQFSQGDIVTPETFGRSFPCDGAWHTQRVTSLEAFEPGWANLTARLSVTDSTTGDPGPQAFVSQRIWVRPAARLVLPQYATLRPEGVVKMVVKARCDKPWVLQDFLIHATQGAAQADRSPTMPCDGVLRSITVWLKSSTSTRFKTGGMQVSGTIDLLDPEFFDPVTQVNASRTVTVRWPS